MHCTRDENQRKSWKKISNKKYGLLTLALTAVVSFFWLLYRTGLKPSRITYPCQQAAVSNISVFKASLVASVPTIAGISSFLRSIRPGAVLSLLLIGSVFVTIDSFQFEDASSFSEDSTRVPIELSPTSALSVQDSSDLFFIQNATGLNGNMDDAVDALIELMGEQGLNFYHAGVNLGLIHSDDVVLLKVNGQWPYRGGTNTDLVRSVIQAITDHPDGFTGEIILADNGQGLGNLDWSLANSFYRNISIQDVVDSFDTYQVSTVLWDDLRSSSVDEYDQGDSDDGYVLSSDWNEETEIYVSYPKFQTDFGTYVSFKNGIWDIVTGWDDTRLKVINMPVMKTHFRYGVTGCIKHYMGVPKGEILSGTIPHEHFSIALGGMATLMTETRAPILNILDTTWINARPTEETNNAGPQSSYPVASFTDIIGASKDPVAMDYWASKNILIPTAIELDYDTYSSLDPDYEPTSTYVMDESFHNYLNRSMNVLNDAGYQTTMNQSEMNVYIDILDGNDITQITTTTDSTPTEPTGLDMTMFVAIPLIMIVVVITAVFMRRRSQ